MEEALNTWAQGHSQAPLSTPASFLECHWTHLWSRLLLITSWRVHPMSDQEHSYWQVPVRNQGHGGMLFLLHSVVFEWTMKLLAVGLRLGATLCYPHKCRHCGYEVDQLATHSLSCWWSKGRHPCHAAINDILCQSLVVAKVPSRLEPNGLYRSDRKRPDGISLAP